MGSDVPPISTSIQAPQVALPQAPGGPIWTPRLSELVEQSPELSARAWKSAEYSPWEAMADQARHLIGTQREAIETFREAPSWQAGGKLLGSSIDTLGEFPSVPWAGAKRGLLKLKELTTGPAGKQFFQDLFQDGPFTEEAKGFFDKELDIGIAQPYGRAMPCREGGYYVAGTDRQPPLQPSLTYLQTANKTTAIHELSHTWWEPKRQEQKDAFIEAMIRFANESKQYQTKSPAMERAILSVWGPSFPPFYSQGARIPTEDDLPMRGKATDRSALGTWGPITDKTQWNDHEMYAYMAMTIAHDIDAVPPYLRQFYEGLFTPKPESQRQGIAPGGQIQATGQIPGAAEWGYSSLWPEEKALSDQMRRDSAERKQP